MLSEWPSGMNFENEYDVEEVFFHDGIAWGNGSKEMFSHYGIKVGNQMIDLCWLYSEDIPNEIVGVKARCRQLSDLSQDLTPWGRQSFRLFLSLILVRPVHS
jgi:hypothetical protein